MWLQSDKHFSMPQCVNVKRIVYNPVPAMFVINNAQKTPHDLPGGRFKNAYELLNLRALKISMLYKNHIFQCMG